MLLCKHSILWAGSGEGLNANLNLQWGEKKEWGMCNVIPALLSQKDWTVKRRNMKHTRLKTGDQNLYTMHFI